MFRDLLVREFAPFGTLSSAQLDLLEAHYRLLIRWNERMNLTRIVKLEEVVRIHYCESLFLATKLPAGPLRVIDVGSGAGFPGIPVAILRADLSVALLESHHRKAVFLAEASRGLANARVLSQRAEECKESFDWVISRAILPSSVLAFPLAENYALLMSRSDFSNLPDPKRFEPIPWDENRVIGCFTWNMLAFKK